jgi:hypothetical protein
MDWQGGSTYHEAAGDLPSHNQPRQILQKLLNRIGELGLSDLEGRMPSALGLG